MTKPTVMLEINALVEMSAYARLLAQSSDNMELVIRSAETVKAVDNMIKHTTYTSMEFNRMVMDRLRHLQAQQAS